MFTLQCTQSYGIPFIHTNWQVFNLSLIIGTLFHPDAYNFLTNPHIACVSREYSFAEQRRIVLLCPEKMIECGKIKLDFHGVFLYWCFPELNFKKSIINSTGETKIDFCYESIIKFETTLHWTELKLLLSFW